jgi:hypothetical protein
VSADERVADLIAGHDAYRVNEDGWTVCICGHVAEGDDDDGSHARHVAAALAPVLAEVRAEAWDEGYRSGVNDEETSRDWTNGQVSPARANPYRGGTP